MKKPAISIKNTEKAKNEPALLKIASAAAAAKYGGLVPCAVSERLRAEYEIIGADKHYAGIFMTVGDFISAALNEGLMAIPQAQTASSAILYFTGATGINPLAPHYFCASKGCGFFEIAPAGAAICGYDLPAKNCPKCSAPLKKDGFDIPYETLLMPLKTGRFCLMFSAEPAAYKILTEKAFREFGTKEFFGAVTTGKDSFSGNYDETTINFDKIFKLDNNGKEFRLVITSAKDKIINPGRAVITDRIKNLSWPLLSDRPECVTSKGAKIIAAGMSLMAVSKDSTCAGSSKFNFVFRDDIFAYLVEKGIERDIAFAASETVRKGKWAAAAPELKADLIKAGCAPEALEEFSAFKYMPAKASGAMEAILASYENR